LIEALVAPEQKTRLRSACTPLQETTQIF